MLKFKWFKRLMPVCVLVILEYLNFMSYLYALKMGILVFPILALIFTFPFILNQYHKYGSISRLRVLIIYSFILYMICIYFLVILPLPNRDDVTHSAGINLCPLAFIGDFFKG